MYYLLRILDNGAHCEKIPLVLGQQSLGRASHSDIPVKNSYCSSHHLDIFVKPDGVFLKDISHNGTFVGKQRLRKHRMTPIAIGNKFGIGNEVIEELIGDPKYLIFCLYKETTNCSGDGNKNSLYDTVITIDDSDSDNGFESDIDQYFEEVDVKETSLDGDPIKNQLLEMCDSGNSSPKTEFEYDFAEKSTEQTAAQSPCENNHQSIEQYIEELEAAIQRISEKRPPVKKTNLLEQHEPHKCPNPKITLQAAMSFTDKQLLAKRLKIKRRASKNTKPLKKLLCIKQKSNEERVMAEKRKKSKLSFDDLYP